MTKILGSSSGLLAMAAMMGALSEGDSKSYIKYSRQPETPHMYPIEKQPNHQHFFDPSKSIRIKNKRMEKFNKSQKRK